MPFSDSVWDICSPDLPLIVMLEQQNSVHHSSLLCLMSFPSEVHTCGQILTIIDKHTSSFSQARNLIPPLHDSYITSAIAKSRTSRNDKRESRLVTRSRDWPLMTSNPCFSRRLSQAAVKWRGWRNLGATEHIIDLSHGDSRCGDGEQLYIPSSSTSFIPPQDPNNPIHIDTQ